VAIGGPRLALPDYNPRSIICMWGTRRRHGRVDRRGWRGIRRGRSGQVVLKTADRLDIDQFPIPAYELADIKHYFLGQHSSIPAAVPDQCEFCDIPGCTAHPRLETPQRSPRTRQAA